MQTGKNYRILKKYLVSFALVFLLPSMLIVLFFNTYTANLISKQSQDRLINQFSNYCENVESRMQNLKNIFLELSVDKETSYLESASSTDFDDVNRLKLFTRKLYVYGFINNMIKSVNIYYIGTDTVINNKGKFSYYYAYDQFLKAYGIPQDDFKKMVSSCTTLKIINTGGTYIAVQSFPIGDNSPSGSIVVNLDERVLLGFSSESGDDMNGSFILADKNGNVIAGNRSQIISTGAIKDSIRENANIKRGIRDGGKEYITMCIKSSVEDLYYLSFIPAAELEGNLNDFNKLMLKVIIVFFILGLTVVWAFSMLNYTPVKTMLKDISAGGKRSFENGKVKSGKVNEYDIIKMYIDDLCKEKDDLSSRVSIHMNETRNSFLKELVINGCSTERFSEMDSMLNLNLQNDYFCFIYIYQDDTFELDANEVNRVFMMQEKIDMLIRKFASGYRLYLDDGNKGILLNLQNDIDIDQIKAEFRQLNEELKEKNLADLKMGIGKIHKGCSTLPQTYREAYEAARYCCFYSLDTCTYEDMMKNAKDNYYYPSVMGNKLMNCCEVGEWESVEAIISEIITRNFINDKLILKSAYSLYYDLKGTLNRAAAKLNIDVSELAARESGIDIDTNAFNVMDDVFNNIKDLGSAICEYENRPRANPAESVTKEVINYINEHYFDKYMSCANVADKFNISQPYLSVILKKNTGLSYGDYVNKLRIKEAKKLLKENELSINEIAVKLGYGSGNGFIRTFKNIEGVTPRQYSNSISDK